MKPIVMMTLMLALTVSAVALMDGKIIGEQKAEAAYGPKLAELYAAYHDKQADIKELKRQNTMFAADFVTALKMSQEK